jgi:hypothetical protein
MAPAVNVDKMVADLFGGSVSAAGRLRKARAILINDVVQKEPHFVYEPGLSFLLCVGAHRKKRVTIPEFYDWRSGWPEEEIQAHLAGGSINEADVVPFRNAYARFLRDRL